MALQKVKEILKQASGKNYAVPSFNVYNYESIAWLIEVAEEENSPVIAMMYPGCSHISQTSFTAITKDLARKIDPAVGLHYDHSDSYDGIMKGIKDGFPSVMIDGSSLPYEENLKLTKKVVETAHLLDIDVEAELGYVGSASRENDFRDTSHFTDPDRAKAFSEDTGIDSLAVAIGSAHGNYTSEPDLDLKRLEEIKAVIGVPLVLHGGSGIPESQLKQAVKKGISKVNIGTEFNQYFFEQVKDVASSTKDTGNMLNCLSEVKPRIKDYFRHKINLLKDI